MYNSGVIIRSGDVNIGLDTIPMLRSFNWPEPDGLTERMAELLDMLLITHHHPDHYDRRLVAECLKRDKPVFMPESLAREWEDAPTLYPAHGGMQEEQNDHLITARHALHVWREAIEDVPLVYYEITGPQEYTLLFSGDADYTRTFCKTPGISVDLLFLPWRNPNARYEEGHAEQTGTTLDAVRVAVDTIQPKAILLEHYAELEHIYQDYPASYDIALNLKKQLDTTPCDWLFWGESILLHP
jgi:L-ascorbate metabolism protein UlaG (beta-lactamase superfamily)